MLLSSSACSLCFSVLFFTHFFLFIFGEWCDQAFVSQRGKACGRALLDRLPRSICRSHQGRPGPHSGACHLPSRGAEGGGGGKLGAEVGEWGVGGEKTGHKRVQRRTTGALEGHSRGAPLYSLLPWPEGHKVGGWEVKGVDMERRRKAESTWRRCWGRGCTALLNEGEAAIVKKNRTCLFHLSHSHHLSLPGFTHRYTYTSKTQSNTVL